MIAFQELVHWSLRGDQKDDRMQRSCGICWPSFYSEERAKMWNCIGKWLTYEGDTYNLQEVLALLQFFFVLIIRWRPTKGSQQYNFSFQTGWGMWRTPEDRQVFCGNCTLSENLVEIACKTTSKNLSKSWEKLYEIYEPRKIRIFHYTGYLKEILICI